MPLDQSRIGYALPRFSAKITEEGLSRFRAAIGEPAPSGAASEAPPTYMKVLEGQDNSSRRIMEALGADLRRVLHAEQQFDYLAPMRVGMVVWIERRVADIFSKKAGALQFVVIESTFSDEAGLALGRSRQIVMVREPAAGG